MNVENLIAEERKRLERIERVHSQKARQFTMVKKGLLRRVQNRERIIRQKEPDARIVLRPPLSVEITKTIQPQRSPLAGSHTNLQNEDLGRQLLLVIHVFEQRPEVENRILHGGRMIHIGLTGGKRLFKSMSDSFLP